MLNPSHSRPKIDGDTSSCSKRRLFSTVSATEKFICGSEKNPKNKEVGACRKSLLMALKHLFQQICKIV